MDELKSKKLQNSYLNFVAIRNMVEYVQRRAFATDDDGFLNTIGFPYVGEIKRDRKKFIHDKMDAFVNSTNEMIILGLVAEVVEYRNRLAHGKRFGNDSVMSFEEIARTLDDVLGNI